MKEARYKKAWTVWFHSWRHRINKINKNQNSDFFESGRYWQIVSRRELSGVIFVCSCQARWIKTVHVRSVHFTVCSLYLKNMVITQINGKLQRWWLLWMNETQGHESSLWGEERLLEETITGLRPSGWGEGDVKAKYSSNERLSGQRVNAHCRNWLKASVLVSYAA